MGIEIEYSQEKELDEALDRLLHSDPIFLPIIDNLKIAACFCIRKDDSEGTVPKKGEPVVIKKMSPAMQIFMKPKAAFIIVVDRHFWENADEREKKGYMHRALSRVKIEKSDKGVKVGMGKWDIQENLATLKAIGAYTDYHVRLVEMVRTKQLTMVQSVVDRMIAAPEEEAAAEPEETPHIVAASSEAVPARKKSRGKIEDEPRRPARPIPPEPVKTSEPEPDPEPEG